MSLGTQEGPYFPKSKAHAWLLLMRWASLQPFRSFLENGLLAGRCKRKSTCTCGWAPPDTLVPFWTTCQQAMKQKCHPQWPAPVILQPAWSTKVQGPQAKWVIRCLWWAPEKTVRRATCMCCLCLILMSTDLPSFNIVSKFSSSPSNVSSKTVMWSH